MTKTLRENTADIKNFMGKENNFITTLIILSLCISIYGNIHTSIKLKQIKSEVNQVNENVESVKKKVDHRYFNTTTSLEQIHHVKIDTYNGKLK